MDRRTGGRTHGQTGRQSDRNMLVQIRTFPETFGGMPGTCMQNIRNCSWKHFQIISQKIGEMVVRYSVGFSIAPHNGSRRYTFGASLRPSFILARRFVRSHNRLQVYRRPSARPSVSAPPKSPTECPSCLSCCISLSLSLSRSHTLSLSLSLSLSL